ncbi:hypothetical protein [Salinibacter ruber]|uniref:hypothetical protein n=2 Tax=Salinibacter ruber TaxID=146919 RepID=UPI0011D21498|nr:hypothetical protein [Salinibacter ruber]
MKFDWHNGKGESNVEKHDLDFLDAVQVFEEEHFAEDRIREEEKETGSHQAASWRKHPGALVWEFKVRESDRRGFHPVKRHDPYHTGLQGPG